MNITLLSVNITTVPTAKGSYQVADIAFKNNSFGGKVEGKKIMSFGATKDAFAVLSAAQPGGSYEVNVVKNDKGYNDWVSVQPAGAAAAVQPVQAGRPAVASAGPSAAPRGNFETPEERAQRQVYIIRQSSIASAVSALAVGSKKVDVNEVLTIAQKLENYVLGKATANSGNPGASGFEDLPNFPAEVYPEVN